MNTEQQEQYRAQVAALDKDGLIAEVDRLHVQKRDNDRRMRELDTEIGRELVERLRERLAGVLEGYGRIRIKGREANDALFEFSAKQQEEYFVRKELQFYENAKKVDEGLDTQLKIVHNVLRGRESADKRSR